MNLTRALLRQISALLLLAAVGATAHAAPAPATYSADEIVVEGHRFFGRVSGGLATMVERIASSDVSHDEVVAWITTRTSTT